MMSLSESWFGAHTHTHAVKKAILSQNEREGPQMLDEMPERDSNRRKKE